MSSHFVLLSDLHLGYDRSVLDGPGAKEHLASTIANLCDGETDRLILNGDIFEACVPRDAGEHDVLGLSPYAAKEARSFFAAILARVYVKSIVIVWGNHDYALWKNLAASCKASTFTNGNKGDVLLQYNGQVLSGAESFLDGVIGPGRIKVARVRSAYPCYVLGRFWPYMVFHHGHLLDDLVLGQHGEAEYAGLKLMTGASRPDINLDDDLSLATLHAKTDDFISRVWETSSKAREIEWAILRRGKDHPRCSSYPQEPAPASKEVAAEPQGRGLGHMAPWFTNLLLVDPTTPPPLGRLDYPGYLFIGHDHSGGIEDIVGMDGHRWRLVNSGGWTDDDNGPIKDVHGHVIVWPKKANAPSVHCAKI